MGRQRDLPILLAGMRHLLAGDRDTPPPEGSDFSSDDQFRDHARALLSLPVATVELIEARRRRDQAWAQNRMVEAQRHGKRIAECESVIEDLLSLLRKPPVRSRKRPSRRARPNPDRQARAREAEARHAEVRRLLDKGLSGCEIAQQLGVSKATVSRSRQPVD